MPSQKLIWYTYVIHDSTLLYMLTQSLIWYTNVIHNTTLVYAFKEIISIESMMSLNMKRRIVIESTFSPPIPFDPCLYVLIIQGIFNGLYCTYLFVCYVFGLCISVDLVFVFLLLHRSATQNLNMKFTKVINQHKIHIFT